MTNISGFKIGSRNVGGHHPCYLIAEVAQAHEGSLGVAHSYIDAAADCGADAVKFQTHIATSESTIDEPFRVNGYGQDTNRFNYWKRMEFTEDQWIQLARHAESRGIDFISSPFSVEAVDLLIRVGIPAWKVGSGESLGSSLLESMVKTKLPILASTGMSSWDEIDQLNYLLASNNNNFALFHCTSMYPTPLENVGLNNVTRMKERYSCPIGLSDHSGTLYPAIAALSRGIELLELHVTFDKRQYGFDVSSSITFDELSQIRKVRDAINIMDNNPSDKDHLSIALETNRKLFSKSLALNHKLSAGSVLKESDLTLKKPGTGIKHEQINQVVGKKLLRDVDIYNILKWDDLAQ